MFGDIYPTKYIGKTTDIFGRSKFQLQNFCYKPKLTYAVDRASHLELLMLVLGLGNIQILPLS